jgi:MOSC domain-containing protein YiiM
MQQFGRMKPLKIISTNIAEPKTIVWQGEEVTTGMYKKATTNSLFLTANGVKDDSVIDTRYHGGTDKACYFYSADHYEMWKQEYPDLDWEWGMFGENMTVEGLNEADVRIGDIYELGLAIVQVTQPRQPCFKLGHRFNDAKMVQKFISKKLPGVYVKVIREGNVSAESTMHLIARNPENMTVAEVFDLIYNGKQNPEKVKAAINMPELADSCKKDLQKRMNR